MKKRDNLTTDMDLEQEGKVIYNFVDVERNLCITFEEIRHLLSQFNYGHPYRISFALLATCGMRGAELCDLRLTDFQKDDLTELQYRIKKISPIEYKTGTKTYNIRIAKRTIPVELADEIKFYINNNFQILKDGKLFRFNEASLRRYLSRLRTQAKKGNMPDEILKKALLDETSYRLAFNVNCPHLYRISLHSFRRFYITYCNAVTHPDLSLLCRHIGHILKETTMMYVYRGENIGLTPELKAKKEGFESLLFNRNQKRINDFL